MNKGFLYVATHDYKYYKSAIYSIESLKDFMPEANVIFFTHEDWVDNKAKSICDTIVTKDVPENNRAKLWALDKTPFDQTVYIDADTEIVHEDIEYIFDELNGHDISMINTRPYASAITKFPAGELTLHCGMIIYESNERVFALFRDWWKYYYLFNSENYWPFDENLYPKDQLAKWDTFVFWWLLNKTRHKDSISISIAHVRFNFVNTFRESELEGKETVVYHKSLPSLKPERNKPS